MRPEVGDAIAGTGAHWRVRLDTISVVKSMLDVVLAARVSGAKPEHSANRSVFVVSKWHRVHIMLSLHSFAMLSSIQMLYVCCKRRTSLRTYEGTYAL